MLAMPAPQFFRMAERIPHYRGVMRTFVEREAHRRQEIHGTANVVSLTPEMARGLPQLEGMVDYTPST